MCRADHPESCTCAAGLNPYDGLDTSHVVLQTKRARDGHEWTRPIDPGTICFDFERKLI